MLSQSPLVYIVILCWNGREDTLECLRSLEKITYQNHHILVVDNASSDGTPAAIRAAFPDIRIITNETNLRFAGGNDVGIEQALNAGPEYILLLNNDTRVKPDFLTNLVKAAESVDGMGMAAPKIYYYDDPRRIWYAGGKISWWQGWISHIGVRETDVGQHNRQCETEYITGCCMLVKRRLIEKVGVFDISYYMYGEDADWSIRAHRAGYKLLYVPSAVIWHKLSVSSGGHLSWFKNWNKLKSQLRLMYRYAKPYHWLTIPFGILYNVVLSYFRAKRSL